MEHNQAKPRESSEAQRNDIEVSEVCGRRARDAFLRFPWRIYADDPQWVPPLLMERKEFIDFKKHPFLRHGAATHFLAFRGGRPVGRILVSDDPNYNTEHATNVGCFGMFETIDDERVTAALLDTAANWLRARGRTQILGPIDYSTNYACGLLIEGFDTPPRIMMNHNPPYYARSLEAWGLAKAKDLYSWWFDDSFDMMETWKEKAKRLLARGRITVRQFQVRDMAAELARCKSIYNSAWERNWGFVKMTDVEFDYLAKDLQRVALPELLLFAEMDGVPVGFSMTLPDINEALRPLNGRLFPWGLPIGLVRYLLNCRRIRTCRLLTLGVMEGYRRRGIAELLILRTLDHGKNVVGFTGAELGWTLEDNELINRAILTVGGKHYKTYRIYQREI
jgi:GNAT superfamily N-acetyltransferase